MKPVRVVPEKLPSGCSSRSRIGTLARLNQTTPDQWPCLLVSLTAQSPQRVPGMAGPSTLQTPSASCGAAAAGSTARSSDTNAVTSRKRDDTRNTPSFLRSIAGIPLAEASPCLEKETDSPLGILAPGYVRLIPLQPGDEIDRRNAPRSRRVRPARKSARKTYSRTPRVLLSGCVGRRRRLLPTIHDRLLRGARTQPRIFVIRDGA